MDLETWKPVPGYEGQYEVSDIGRVRSLDRVDPRGQRRKGQVSRPGIDSRGYRVVALSKNGVKTRFSVHRLVALAFHGSAPEGKPNACHKDGDSLNNCAENLYWGSQFENMQDRLRHGTYSNGTETRTHCPRQHPLQAPNLVASAARNGYRACRSCAQTRAHIQGAKRRGKDLSDQFQVISDKKYAQIMGGVQ
ncbi:NUMOD4 motif-containing HNH endonuclease [Amycolatopsis sp. FDAARGOS 1241]|nr:NUMOD4 motif-containing HNH endonuclease [Amycolatopsis sp. FDAARGOS 1241]